MAFCEFGRHRDFFGRTDDRDPKKLVCVIQVERRLGREAMARFDRYNEACEATDPGHVAHYLGSGRSPCNYDQDRARSSGISQRKSKDVVRRRRRAANGDFHSSGHGGIQGQLVQRLVAGLRYSAELADHFTVLLHCYLAALGCIRS